MNESTSLIPALTIYTTLVSLGGTHASSWRHCAAQLFDEAAHLRGDQRTKLIDRANDCMARAAHLDLRVTRKVFS